MRTFLVFILGLAFASTVVAAGSSSSSTNTSEDTLNQAIAAVDKQDYQRARKLLLKVVKSDSGNADAWNYLGFSHRKLNELDASLKAYQKALVIDPNHRGANEYLGELYLLMKDPVNANKRLRKLEAICAGGCEELDDLKSAITAYTSG